MPELPEVQTVVNDLNAEGLEGAVGVPVVVLLAAVVVDEESDQVAAVILVFAECVFEGGAVEEALPVIVATLVPGHVHAVQEGSRHPHQQAHKLQHFN